MKFMTSNGGALQPAEGPMISTNKDSVDVGNRSLVKREPESKFLIKEKLGHKSLIKRELGYIPFIGMGTFLHRNGYILPS